MIKNILFDLDGTIIDSSPGIIEGFRYSLTQHGYEVPDIEVLHSCIGPPLKDSFLKRIGCREEDIDSLVKTYRSIYDDKIKFNCSVYDGIEECLSSLNKRGYSIKLCSSKIEKPCREIMEKYGLEQYFTDIVGSDYEQKKARKVDVIDECFRRSPWQKKEETILVGDSIYDVEGANEAGIRCIAVSYGFGNNQQMLDAGAVALVDSPLDVVKYIEEH